MEIGMAERLFDENDIHEEHWEPPVRNLDRFFTSMYQYYVAKGLPAVILQQIIGVATLGLTIAFSIFLVAFVDWGNLNNCKDETSCNEHFVIKQPFAHSSVGFSFAITVYGLLFCAFWIWRVVSASHIISSAIVMEKFYREKLGLRLSDLNEMQWHEVLQRLIRLHEHGIHRVAVQDKLTEHDVVLRIMRKDNYMIGLINKKLLDLRVPWWITPIMTERLFLTKSLEWSLSFCILEYMFNEQFVISTSFLKKVTLLQTRLRVVGVVHMMLLPFMVLFMSIHFFLQNAQSFHSSKSYLGPRQWSPLALWTFREFNELPHIFNERINQSYEPSNEYIQSFYNPYAAMIARFVSYVGGAFIATILLISFFSEGALLYVHFLDHNLLWYLGIFSAIYAGSRSLIPDETKRKEAPNEIMANVQSCTHYFPTHWVNRCHTTSVKDEMSELFPYKIHLFYMELMSVLLTPIVLCFSLPSSAQTIIDFVREHSKYVEGVGAVCNYSLFEFETMGDEQYGAPVKGSMDESQRPDNGKMEKSFMNFQHAHPNWRSASGGGEALLERVQTYRAVMENKRDQSIASALQGSVNFHLGGDSLAFSQVENSGLNANDKKNSTLSREVDHVDKDTILQHEQQQQSPLQKVPADISLTAVPPIDTFPTNNIASKAPFTGLGGVWGPNGYTRGENTNHNQVKDILNSRILPSGDGVAMSYYKSVFNNRESFSQAASQGPYGDRSVAFSPDRIRSRHDMPSILRSILKEENIDYQNDFYWMNRFKEERMRDPENFDKSLNQSMLNMSRTGLNGASTMGGSMFLDQDIPDFNGESGVDSRFPPFNPSKGLSKGQKWNGENDKVESELGFCFSVPNGPGGLGNSHGLGFSSVLDGDMMHREIPIPQNRRFSEMELGSGDKSKKQSNNPYDRIVQPE